MAKPKPKRRDPDSLPDQLRGFIRESGLTAYALGQLAGVDRVQIQRFLARERGLGLETAGRIAAALGLELARRKGRGGPAYQAPPRRSAPKRADPAPVDLEGLGPVVAPEHVEPEVE